MKDGTTALLSLIAGIDSLLQICRYMKEVSSVSVAGLERGMTLLKRKRTRSKQSVEEEERNQPMSGSQFHELSFSLSYIYVIIYRPLVFEKYVFLLFNYSFNPPTTNRCLYNYFNNMFCYMDDENGSVNPEYDEAHPEVKATLRPRLYNVLLFEVLNRILHDPLTAIRTDESTKRNDLIELAELGKKIVSFLIDY